MRIVFSFLLFAGFCATAQVKIGDNATTVGASALLELESTDKALVITRVSSTAAITTPVNGMFIYDSSSNCIKSYRNNAWTGCYLPGEYAEDYVQLSLIGVKDKNYGDLVHDFIYLPVVGEDGRTWLNNNLGAHYSNTQHERFDPKIQATDSNDHLAYGSLFQWGRMADGHELVSWSNSTTGTRVNGTTATNADLPADALFIMETDAPYDWRVTQDGTLWDGTAAVNNPCPIGYRIPTDAELTAYILAASVTDSATAASSDIALSCAGYVSNDALMTNTGTRGYYWSSTADGTDSLLRYISDVSTNSNSYDGNRVNGYSVRCIQD